MARKKHYNYFDQFSIQMDQNVKAATQLVDLLENYVDIENKAAQIHETEHAADLILHELMFELNRSFITPIDREDIMQLAGQLDDITDSIEDVSNLFDMLSITEVKQEAMEMSRMILKACKSLCKMMAEFADFKHSKRLSEMSIEVNRIEEEGDRLHRNIIKELYVKETNPIEIMKWKEIFDTMEEVLDNCENAADLVEGLVIKNS